MDLKELAAHDGARHPWEVARARALRRLVDTMPLPEAPSIVDIGAGDGYACHAITHGLPSAVRTCVDAHYTTETRDGLATRYAGARFESSADALSPGDADLLLLLDVIEHVEDDIGFVRAQAALLRRGGHALITVPAFQALFSEHDRFLEHYRRYDRAGIVRALEEGGLEVCESGYLFGSLLAPRALTVLKERIRHPRPITGVASWQASRAITRGIVSILDADNRALLALARRGIYAPGLSAWAIARRR